MKRTVVAALAITATLAIISLGNGMAGSQDDITPLDEGGYEICGDYLCYVFFEETVTDFKINATIDGQRIQYSVFDIVKPDKMQPLGPPKVGDGAYLIDGESAVMKAYDIPMGVMSFKSKTQNAVTMTMSPDIGAIYSENSAVVGQGRYRGELALMGVGNVTHTAQEITFNMEPDDTIYYRTSYIYTESVGSDIVGGRIAGEMYLEANDGELESSVIDYQPIEMEVTYSTENRIDIVADASFSEGRTMILTLDKSALDVALEDLRVKLDGESLQQAEDVRSVISSSEETYYALENDDSTQLFIYVPHFSQRTITLSGIEPKEIGLDLYLGAAASLFLVVAATVYLFRRKD